MNAAEENHFILDAFDCEVMFYQESFAAIVTELRPRLPKIRHWICIDGEGTDVLLDHGLESLFDFAITVGAENQHLQL